jgi:hypothetical protein
VRPLLLAHVEHDEALAHAELRSRETDAGSGVHELGHLPSETRQVAVGTRVDRLRHLREHRIRVYEHLHESQDHPFGRG